MLLGVTVRGCAERHSAPPSAFRDSRGNARQSEATTAWREQGMGLEQRQEIMKRIEAERGGRTLVCYFNFDRDSTPPIPGLRTQFASDTKEALFRVLKESVRPGGKIDVCLYTRGGDVNAVWPIATLLREFDPDFAVLVPFRCHSGGTLLALGAKKILMTPLAELSPIDPSTGNQFNPSDPTEPRSRLAISVEDVQAYRSFVLDQFQAETKEKRAPSVPESEVLRPFLERLAERVHPLALGNVHRVHQQIKQLACRLLQLSSIKGRDLDRVVAALTTDFYSHLHMINRQEARDILGDAHVEFTTDKLASLLDELLRGYEEDFKLRRPFFLNAHLGDDREKEVRFIGGAVESKVWSYLFETKANVRQNSALPANVQVQLPAGQPMPLIPGLPREYHVEVISQCWMRNTEPRGVTL